MLRDYDDNCSSADYLLYIEQLLPIWRDFSDFSEQDPSAVGDHTFRVAHAYLCLFDVGTLAAFDDIDP